MNQKEFNRRIKHNTELFNRQQKSNTFTPSLYYMWDKKPKELSPLQYCRHIHDIHAAAVTGTLATSTTHGHDAIEMKGGKQKKVELKTAYVNTKSVWKTKKDKIYVGYRTPILSYIGASFNGHPPEDDHVVYFVCCDTSGKWDTEVIGVWQSNGQDLNDKIESSTGRVTLSWFVSNGKRKNVKADTIGWSHYQSTLLKRLPVKTTINI